MEIINVYVLLVGKDVIVMKVIIHFMILLNFVFLCKGFEVTIPHFNRQSYFELKTQITTKHIDNQLLRIDLIFASEYQNGLLLYADDKLTEFYFIISIRNYVLDIT
jgi:hypothetical protein